MKVILLQEIKGQGGEGDVVEVKRGYAVNYLFPQKLAIEASKGNLKQLELRRHNIAKREADRLDSADKIQAALADKTLTILARVGEEGQLFGSVTTQLIAEKLHEEMGLEIERKKIDLHAPIKTAGEHTVTVTVYREIKAILTINVVDEKADLEEGEAADDAAGEAAGDAAATEAATDGAAADGAAETEAAEDEEVADDAAADVETAPEIEAEAAELAEDIVEISDEALKTVADKLVEATDAVDDEDADPEALAEAAVEVLQEAEAVVDDAIEAALEGALTDDEDEDTDQ